MTRSSPFTLLVLAALLGLPAAPGRVRAEDDNHAEETCGHLHAADPVFIDKATPPRYAPDREAEIRHLALDVTPDFGKRTVAGRATWTFRPIARPLAALRLDAVNLNVSAVNAEGAKVAGFDNDNKKLTITFAEPIPAGHEVRVSIDYRAEPVQGLYFRTPAQGYKPGDEHLFSQGESEEARHWYPSPDYPNAKFTSEVTCRVPAGMTVVSNGLLVDEKPDPATGLKAVHWSQEQPHVNYLLTLVAGYFQRLEDKHRDVPLTFYTPPSDFPQAANSFAGTRDIMAFFEQEIGVPFPWSKYAQVCTQDFVAGGMENSSATTLTTRTLFEPKESENIRTSRGLVAHEMAHQWFGDFVTCKDWSHLWLNESFATYYDHLHDGHANGRDAMLYGMLEDARKITAPENAEDLRPIVRRNYETASKMFNYLTYPKGSWVLHMLRAQLGEDLYRQCIKTYLERHRYGTVVTDDLRAVIEELSGRSWDRFFDQWVYHALQPDLEVKYSWDEATKLAKLSVSQKQRTEKNQDKVMLFEFPLTVRFASKAAGRTERTVQVTQADEDFYFPVPAKPELVRLDPEYTLLAKLRVVDLPKELLYAQLAQPAGQDAIGRALAAEALGEKTDADTVTHLRKALNEDAFYGARIEAAKALAKIRTPDALRALAESRAGQTDARVRNEVTLALGKFYAPAARQALLDVLAKGTEKNPLILGNALRGLGQYGDETVRTTLASYLESRSFRNSLATDDFEAIKTAGDPALIPALRGTLERRVGELATPGFNAGLDALATLGRADSARHEQGNSAREFLMFQLNNPRPAVRVAAINALGVLHDDAALPALQNLAASAPAGGRADERGAAEKSVAAIREGRAPAPELKELREEVLELQKNNREMKDAVDELRKKVEASSPAAATPAPKPAGS